MTYNLDMRLSPAGQLIILFTLSFCSSTCCTFQNNNYTVYRNHLITTIFLCVQQRTGKHHALHSAGELVWRHRPAHPPHAHRGLLLGDGHTCHQGKHRLAFRSRSLDGRTAGAISRLLLWLHAFAGWLHRTRLLAAIHTLHASIAFRRWQHCTRWLSANAARWRRRPAATTDPFD